ncbi:MAG: hypothetical protein Q8Q63_12245, partial [Phaeovulum sp.]|nr:hypothetical protein [Phaeovulum sp.]
PAAFAQSVIGCYDYDPFGAFLQFPVYMVWQDSHALVQRAFALLDQGAKTPVLEMIPPVLVPPRTILPGTLSEQG